MSKKRIHKARVQDELEEQLEQADREETPVQAVFFLRADDEDNPRFSPSWTENKAKELIQRVGEQVGETVEDYNVFRYLGSFVVLASASVVRKLIEQEEVASAAANRPDAGPPNQETKARPRRRKRPRAAKTKRRAKSKLPGN